MKNKPLAIFGIIMYILSVLSSAENLQGVATAPIWLLILSVIAEITFYILAVKRLWFIQKLPSICLIFSWISLVILSINPVEVIVIINILKVVHFLALMWMICLLWVMDKVNNSLRG